MPKYTNDAQQRMLKLITTLAGNEVVGVSPATLVKQLEVSPSMITRDLANGCEAGWVQEIESTGRYRLTPMVGRLSITILRNFDKSLEKLAELSKRYGGIQ